MGVAPLVLIALWLSIYEFRHPERIRMIDLMVYRAGGAALAHGQPLYSAHAPGGALPFTYPPFAGLLCVPLAVPDFGVAQLLMTGASMTALALTARACARAGRLPGPAAALLVAAAGLCLEPVRATLEFGQVNLLLMAAVVLDLTASASRRSRGVWVGLAAAVKLTPLIFIGYLLASRQWRAAGTVLVTFLATVAAGWVVLPAESARYWLHLVAQPGRVGGVAYNGNQSLLGVLTRLLPDSALVRPAWLAAAALVAALGLVGAAALSGAGRELAGISVAGLTGLLVSPISWTHHWVWVLPAAAAAAGWIAERPASGRRLATAVLIGAGLLFVLAPVWWPPIGGDRLYRHPGVERLAANSYVLAGLAVLAAAAGYALTRRVRRAPRRRLIAVAPTDGRGFHSSG